MTHPNGTKGESALVAYARANGFGGADRLTKTGAHDRGDVTLGPGVMAEVKHVKVAGRYGPATELLADWMAQTRLEHRNGGWSHSALVVKREGTNDVGRWFAYVDLSELATLAVVSNDFWMVRTETQRLPVCIPVRDWLRLLRAAGWGDPL